MPSTMPTEAEFRHLYIEKALPGREIAAIYGVSLDQVYRWKTRYVVEKVPKWARRKVPPLNAAPLRSVLLGSMLGDGSITPKADSVGGYIFGEGHSIDQRAYLEWKRSVWGAAAAGGWAYRIGEEAEGKTLAHPDHPGREYKARPKCWFNTVTHGALRPWWEVFYRDADIGAGGQRLKRFKAGEVLDLVGGSAGLDDVALAVWYADDGTAGHWPMICVGPRNRAEAGVLLRAWGFDPTESSTGQEIRGREQADEFVRRVGGTLLALPDVSSKVLGLGYRFGGAPDENAEVHRHRNEGREEVQEDAVQRLGVVLRLGREGVSATEIAVTSGFSRKKVVTALREAGLEVVRCKRPIPKELVERAEAGESMIELAAAFGWDRTALGRRLDALGVSRRGPGSMAGEARARRTFPGVTPEGLRELLIEHGGSIARVCRHLGVHRDVVKGRVKLWGLGDLVVHRQGAGRQRKVSFQETPPPGEVPVFPRAGGMFDLFGED